MSEHETAFIYLTLRIQESIWIESVKSALKRPDQNIFNRQKQNSILLSEQKNLKTIYVSFAAFCSR